MVGWHEAGLGLTDWDGRPWTGMENRRKPISVYFLKKITAFGTCPTTHPHASPPCPVKLATIPRSIQPPICASTAKWASGCFAMSRWRRTRKLRPSGRTNSFHYAKRALPMTRNPTPPRITAAHAPRANATFVMNKSRRTRRARLLSRTRLWPSIALPKQRRLWTFVLTCPALPLQRAPRPLALVLIQTRPLPMLTPPSMILTMSKNVRRSRASLPRRALLLIRSSPRLGTCWL